MSARSVWSGMRPSLYCSVRDISAPPSRPASWILIPLAPASIVCSIARSTLELGLRVGVFERRHHALALFAGLGAFGCRHANEHIARGAKVLNLHIVDAQRRNACPHRIQRHWLRKTHFHQRAAGAGVFLNQWAYSVQQAFAQALPFFFAKSVNAAADVAAAAGDDGGALSKQHVNLRGEKSKISRHWLREHR